MVHDAPMQKISLFVCGLLLAVGCGKKDPIDDAISALEKFKGQMCACKDKACTEKVHADYKKYGDEVLKPKMKGIDPSKVDKSKMEKGDKLDKEMRECEAKFEAPEAPPAPPAGETPPAPPAGGEAPAAPPAGSAAP